VPLVNCRRGTSSANKRGNTRARKRRREWLIDKFGIARKRDGRKTRIRCAHCGKVMRAEPEKVWTKRGHVMRYSWEVDRFPICGHAGGKYVRGNIVPACPDCNKRRCTVVKKCRKSAIDFVGRPSHSYAHVMRLLEAAA
jgi:hypothetical protein